MCFCFFLHFLISKKAQARFFNQLYIAIVAGINYRIISSLQSPVQQTPDSFRFRMASEEDQARLKLLGDYLHDESKPLKARFRALLALRNNNSDCAVDEISKSFVDKSVLLKHELAYCLGQMGNAKATTILTNILANLDEHPMVRHEAAEALVLLSTTEETKDLLSNYFKDQSVDVAETCEIAYSRLSDVEKKGEEEAHRLESFSSYDTRDPALPFSENDKKSCKDLKEILLHRDLSLYFLYQALFTLRNMGTDEAILAICEGLKNGKSALLRHEVAYVLGQLQSPLSIPALKENLENMEENEMVRHESAEALGAIGTQECIEILKRFLNDSKRVVRESCVVALDISEYELSSAAYANSLDFADIIIPFTENSN